MEAEKQRMYLCIDGKSFYASVECAERGLNPFETNLVVADPSRGKNALCLAITPKMKTLGVHNRCRLSDIPGNISSPHKEVVIPLGDILRDILRPGSVQRTGGRLPADIFPCAVRAVFDLYVFDP